MAATPALAQKQYGPGVTDAEVKIGTTTPYSGPASAYSAGAVFRDRDMELSLLLPGIRLKTSPTDLRPIKQMRLVRFDGARYVLFSDVLASD